LIENYSEEGLQQVAGINKGKSLSSETRALIREAALKRKPMSIEIRLKCAVNVCSVIITELVITELYGKTSAIIY
jgi:hypothetical protein